MSLEDRIGNIRFKPSESEVSEDQVKEITRSLLFDLHVSLEHDKLVYEIIKLTKCDVFHAWEIIQKMDNLGLNVCRSLGNYSISEFAEMREYVTDDELEEIYDAICDNEKREEEHNKYFEEKYGKDCLKWSEEVWDSYKYGDEGWENF